MDGRTRLLRSSHLSLEWSVEESVHALFDVFAHDFVVPVDKGLSGLDGRVDILHGTLESHHPLVDQLVTPETDPKRRTTN